MGHPDRDQLLEFASGRAPEGEAEAIYVHLDSCAACHDRYLAIRAIRTDFQAAWSRFTGEALEPLAGLDWVPLLTGVVDGIRRLASAAGGVVADVAAVGRLETAFIPAYAGVGNPAATPETARHLEAASAHCAAGEIDAAMSRLEAAATLDAAATAAARVEIRHAGQRVGHVLIDAGSRSVAVLIEPDRLVPPPTAARLRAGASPTDERRAPLEPVPGASYRLAEFADVPDGPLSVGLSWE